MTTIAAGASATITVAPGGQVAISSNGGLWTTLETPTIGPARASNHGPTAHTRIYGPYVGGATLVITNQSVNTFNYVDYEVGSTTLGTIAVGASTTFTLAPQGTLGVSNPSGYWQVVVTPAIGNATTTVYGPGTGNMIFGPYPAGATVVVTNQTGAALVTSMVTSSTAPTSVLRFAAAENRYPTSTFTTLTTKLNFFVRRTVHIGSSDLSGVIATFGANVLIGSGDSASGAYNITAASFERVTGGTAQSQPFLFSGGRTKSINSGDSDIQTDVLLPAAFGLAAFTRGDVYTIRVAGTVAAAGVTLPAISSTYVSQPTDYDISYDPGTGTAGPVDGTGAPVVTASTFTFLGVAKFACQLLGIMPLTAKSLVGIGDSIVAGQNQTETNGFTGFFGRSLLGPDGNTASAVLGGCNFGLPGSTSSLWTSAPKARAMFKYANIMVEEFGTNGIQSAAQMTLCQGLWSSFKAAAPAGTTSKVIRTMLIAETTATQSVSSISGDGTTATLTASTSFVASVGTVGATRVCIVTGASPAGYNGTYTMTVASTTTVTYPNVTTGASSGTILISDQWTTDTNQTKISNWQPAGTVEAWNNSLVTQNAGTPGFDTLVDFQAITKGTGGDRYLWTNNGTPNYATTDGIHPSAAICTPMAVQVRAAVDAL